MAQGSTQFECPATLAAAEGQNWCGFYECKEYLGSKLLNGWHFVTIEREGPRTLRWSNRFTSWTLHGSLDENRCIVWYPSKTSYPYANVDGEKQIVFTEKGVSGPHGEFYSRVKTFSCYKTSYNAAVPMCQPQSHHSYSSVNLHLRNESKLDLELFWLNYKGKPVFYQTIRAGQQSFQQTYVTHPWFVQGKGSNMFGTSVALVNNGPIFYPTGKADQNVILTGLELEEPRENRIHTFIRITRKRLACIVRKISCPCLAPPKSNEKSNDKSNDKLSKISPFTGNTAHVQVCPAAQPSALVKTN